MSKKQSGSDEPEPGVLIKYVWSETGWERDKSLNEKVEDREGKQL